MPAPQRGIPERINQIALALSHALSHDKAFIIQASVRDSGLPCYCICVAGRQSDGSPYVMPLAAILDETVADLIEDPRSPRPETDGG